MIGIFLNWKIDSWINCEQSFSGKSGRSVVAEWVILLGSNWLMIFQLIDILFAEGEKVSDTEKEEEPTVEDTSKVRYMVSLLQRILIEKINFRQNLKVMSNHLWNEKSFTDIVNLTFNFLNRFLKFRVHCTTISNYYK